MPQAEWTPQEEASLAQLLASRVRDRASGRHEAECLRNYPRDVYFVGNLRPRRDEPNHDPSEPAYLRDLLSKLAPVAFGAEFNLNPKATSLEVAVSLRWACYYRVFPTLAQQKSHQGKADSEEGGQERDQQALTESETSTLTDQTQGTASAPTDAPDSVAEDTQTGKASPEVDDSRRDRRRARNAHDSLFIRFKKISCEATGAVAVQLSSTGECTADVSQVHERLSQEVARARDVAASDPDRIRVASANQQEKVRVPDTALVSEQAYSQFLGSLKTEVVPHWQWEARAVVQHHKMDFSREMRLEIELTNSSQAEDDSPNTEGFLFDTEATFDFARDNVRTFEVDLVPRGFRYDRNVWARGINCAVVQVSESGASRKLATAHAPVHTQPRFATRTDPPASFAALAQDPMPTLERILRAMESYKIEWGEQRKRYVEADDEWTQKHSVEFERDRRKFDAEIDDFREGYELIRADSNVRLAFQLTNETFARGTKSAWRLFQIVFLVSQIPGMAELARSDRRWSKHRERVDIVYFPTGGGKTEAYLAVVVFHCFFDRLRGKAAGVTAWTRFPLRLLTLQQTQRVTDAIGAAELVRRSHADPRLSGSVVDGFSVGYFVGQGGSPNEIANPQLNRFANAEEHVVWSKANDARERQEWKRVVKCPACNTNSVSVEFQTTGSRLVHRCTSGGCAFPEGIIPLFIVDNEIYRYLPSVVVGTIDKLAGLGNQRKFALLFGQVDGRCQIHGYYKGACCQKDCSDRNQLVRGAPAGLTGPTLFVQDELHLLKEGLGTFDAHYESFTQQIRIEYGQSQPLKVIASSATIEAFERQVNHLYGRDPSVARVFPGLGPTREQSFYAETLSFPQRLFVGVIPHNKTIFNAILELLELYHREVQGLLALSAGTANPYGGAIAPASQQWRRILDCYATSLTYFLAGRELSAIRADLVGDVIPNLEQDGLLPIEVSELTGSTSTDDVSRILEKLEREAGNGSPPDAVLATSMVSHGVDIDRLNAMVFYGMPRQNAEYIQASSRVGRTHVGIVFSCFHPVRERDQSHYAYFLKFHEFLGQLVEPVAINRWSKFSINRTLPGLFMAVLLQVIAARSNESRPGKFYKLDFVRGKISDGSLRLDDFIPILERAYGVQAPSTIGERTFRDEIHRRVQQYFDWIQTPTAGATFVSDVLIPKPMRSLREVDEAIPIELDSLGSQWSAGGGNEQGELL